MKIYQLLLVITLLLAGCAKNTAMPSSLKQVEIKENGDLDALLAYDFLYKGLEAQAFSKFYELWEKTGDLASAKEAFRLAFILRDSKKLAKLEPVVKKAFKNDPEVTRLLIGLEMNKGNFALAKKMAKALAAKETNVAANHSILGTLYAMEDLSELSVTEFKRAYSIEPSEMNLLKLMDALNTLNRRESLLAYANDWVNKNGCSKQVCMILLAQYAVDNDTEQMIKVYEKLYQKFNDENLLKEAVALFLYKNDFQGAKNFLEKYPFDETLLMEVYAQLGLLDNAYELANKIYESTKDPQYLARMAVYKYEKNGKNTSAFELEQIVRMFEKATSELEDALHYNYYGYLLIDHDIDVDKGLKLVLKAHELDSSALFIVDSVAWGYYKKGDCKTAKEWLDRVMVDPNFANSQEVIEHMDSIQKCLMEKKQ